MITIKIFSKSHQSFFRISRFLICCIILTRRPEEDSCDNNTWQEEQHNNPSVTKWPDYKHKLSSCSCQVRERLHDRPPQSQGRNEVLQSLGLNWVALVRQPRKVQIKFCTQTLVRGLVCCQADNLASLVKQKKDLF